MLAEPRIYQHLLYGPDVYMPGQAEYINIRESCSPPSRAAPALEDSCRNWSTFQFVV